MTGQAENIVGEGSQTRPFRGRPLCVDVDGTLLRTDLLYESLCRLLSREPLTVLLLPVWLLRGKAHLKRMIASRVQLDPSTLPYESGTLRLIQEEHAVGRRIVLASASDKLLVEPIARHLKIIDSVMASDGVVSLSGVKKAWALSARFGAKEFDYVGNSSADIPVWDAARESYAVVPPQSRAGFLKSNTFAGVIHSEPSSFSSFLRLMRTHQWVKNLLVFLPLVMAHRLTELPLLLSAATAFLAFSLVASSVYVVNDLLDLDADRAHPRKSKRPLASGEIQLRTGLIIAPVLVLLGGLISLSLSSLFTLVLCSYLAMTFAYSLRLKQVPLLDVLFLALLYGVRIVAGGVACGVPVSAWLLAFSLFFFFGLACVKRSSELLTMRKRGIEEVAGRGYRATDLEIITALGTGSSLVSVLVLALYINGREVSALYAHPTILWVICPALLYWVSRVWLLAHRGEMHDDPVVFALRDRQSYVLGALVALMLLLAV